jgi:subtilisin family serine protease
MKLFYPIAILLVLCTQAFPQGQDSALFLGGYTQSAFVLRQAAPAQDRSGNGKTLLSKRRYNKPEKANQIILRLQAGVPIQAFMRSLQSKCPFAQLNLKTTLAESHQIYLLSASQIIDRQALVQYLQGLPEVVAAAWNTPVRFRDTEPNDALFVNQWSMDRIGATKVWDTTTGGNTAGGREIVVAVLDKGFDLSHPDLAANLWQNPGEIPNDGLDNDNNGFKDDVYGWNFRANSPLFSVERHGTAVSGIIGANGDNGIGTAGINWNVKLMFIAVEYVDEVIAGFNYVLDQRKLYNETNGEKGAFVVVTNGSFGIDQVKCSEQPIWGSMYDLLGEVGVLNVAATANGDWDVEQVGDIPTSCTSEYLIAVTNTDQNDKRANGAAYGKFSIDLGAPGQGISSTDKDGGYRNDFSGTSAACPHVAGAVALLYSVPCTALDSLAKANPSECAKLMRRAIVDNTDAVFSLAEETVSGGRLNIYEGMKYLHAYCISSEYERQNGDFKDVFTDEKRLVNISPNPSSDRISIDYGSIDFKTVKIRVFNMLGQEVIFNQVATPEPFAPQSIEIDVRNWQPGVYVVNMYDLNKKISLQFLKN